MKAFFLTILFLIINFNLYSKSLFDSELNEIKFVSENVEQDKLNAILEIKYNSINEIFKNILIKDDYDNLKRDINEDFINFFIQNIIFEDEKIINNNYYSKVKINFNKKKIINYLRDNKIPYVEYYPNNFLTIILESNELGNTLFSKHNKHYNYLLNNQNKYPFYYIPKMDINDRFLLSPNDITNNIIKIGEIKKKYLNKNTIIIISNEVENKINYLIYLFYEDELLNINNFYYDEFNYSKLFSDIEGLIINKWKSINYIQNDYLNSLNCKINYFNLMELKQIKLFMNDVSIIKNISLRSISYKNNIYDIEFYGNQNLLPKLFELSGLNIKLSKENCKIYLK